MIDIRPEARPEAGGVDVEAHPETARNARLMRFATYASVAAAATLILVKFVAWLLTGSVSMLSTLVDSVLDMLASLLNLLAVRYALQPADHEHRFGHGKAEALAGLGQSLFIFGSAMWLLYEATKRLMAPVPLHNTSIGIAVMVFAIAVTLGLVAFQRYVVRKTGSVAIGADSLHYKGDVLVNLSVIAALVLASQFGLTYMDGVFGAGIALYILFTAGQIAWGSLHLLMDRELPDEDRERIRKIVLSHPEVQAMHDLRTRSSGLHAFIQLHIEMDGNLPLWQAHDISDAVEAKIREAYPNAEVIIHQDPEGVEEDRATFARR